MAKKPNLKTKVCVKKLRVVAEPARLAVLEALLAGPKRVGELGEALRLEQSLLSHHLRVLREEGFVKATRRGKTMIYRITDEALTESRGALNLGCCILSFS